MATVATVQVWRCLVCGFVALVDVGSTDVPGALGRSHSDNLWELLGTSRLPS